MCTKEWAQVQMCLTCGCMHVCVYIATCATYANCMLILNCCNCYYVMQGALTTPSLHTPLIALWRITTYIQACNIPFTHTLCHKVVLLLLPHNVAVLLLQLSSLLLSSVLLALFVILQVRFANKFVVIVVTLVVERVICIICCCWLVVTLATASAFVCLPLLVSLVVAFVA